MGEIDLIPTECDKFGNAQTVPMRDQDHGCVAVTVAASSASRLA
jgi:hypothetical protein